MAKKLTPKQQRFCEEYLIDLNATQAAIRSGYSKHTAQRIGSENLSKPLISDEISRLKSERSENTKIGAAWVLEELVDIHVAQKLEAPQHALRSLELIGKHVDVQAFKDKTEHVISDSLAERILRARERSDNDNKEQ